GKLLEVFLKAYGVEDIYYEKYLISAWPTWMPKHIADRTQKLYVKNKILCVKISSAPLKQELTMQKTKLLRQIRDSIPQAGIKNLQIL
ncbi:MAG: DUF721 domain-containing protein, partial [Cytophagales bacterium]|nr:DUF721 domain-containing protein [Cytophagales bacterium]